MPKYKRARLFDSRGTNLLEFAMMLPLLLLILLGALEMGRVFFIRIALTSAAQAGAQYGAQTSGTALDYVAMQDAAEADFGGTFGLDMGFQLQGEPQTPCFYYSCWDGSVESDQTDCVQNEVDVTAPECTGTRLIQYVRVDTTVNFQSLFDYPGFPSTFTMNGHAVMRIP
jgi:Flp pilus assembly protein TadG